MIRFFLGTRGRAKPEAHSARRRALRPVVERLEQHCLLSTFSVINVDDSGKGSLRQAILDANANPGRDIVDFAIGTKLGAGLGTNRGVQTIRPRSALPVVTDPLIIDGFSQPKSYLEFRYDPLPMIELDGSDAVSKAAGAVVDGLRFASTASGSVVQGLVINRFTGNGIVLDGGSNNVLRGNYIGTNATGTVGFGNGGSGVVVNSSPYNMIGGSSLADRNVISGNRGVGIRLTDGIASYNNIQNNYIGIDVSGTYAIGNRLGGIALNTGSGNTIDGNVISGNGGGVDPNDTAKFSGILIVGNGGGVGASDNLVKDNRVGTDATGMRPLGNAYDGIQVLNAPRNRFVGNVTSANGHHGIDIEGAAAGGNLVKGNYAGTDAAGTGALANGFDGVAIVAPRATVSGNILSGNGRAGLYLFTSLASDAVIEGNRIGTDGSGTAALGNRYAGIVVLGSVSGVTIGGATPGAGNTISGNFGPGVLITDYSHSIQVVGNRIGIGSDDRALGNAGAGISIRNNSSHNTIGGRTPDLWNIIAYNGGAGINILSGVGNTVLGNVIYSNGGRAPTRSKVAGFPLPQAAPT
ncbi:MAG: right-handed parallel beta-helix repeat-containing protein [Singulisphaera sp.]